MELLVSEILWIVTSAFLAVGITVLVFYRKLLPSILLSRVKREKRRLHLPDFSTVVTVFVFLLIVLLLLSVFQMQYEHDYTVGSDVPTDFFLFRRELYRFDTLGILFLLNFSEAGLFYVYDCILYKSFKRVGFTFLPLRLLAVFFCVFFQEIYMYDMFPNIVLIGLFAIAETVIPLLKVLMVKRGKRETILLLFRGVWRTATTLLLVYMLDPIFEWFSEIMMILNYFAVIYMVALVFSLTDAIVKTMKFFSEFANMRRTIKHLENVQERQAGLNAIFELDEEEAIERAALSESITALESYPPRFFVLYDWILAWKFPKAYELWKKR